MARAVSESGEILLDKLPVPKNLDRAPRVPTERPPRKPLELRRAGLAGVGVVGLVLGLLLRPVLTTDSRIGDAQRDVLAAHEAAAKAESTSTKLAADLAKAKSMIASTDVKLKVLQQTQAQVDDDADRKATKAKATEAVRLTLAAALDKAAGTATAEGDAVVLALFDKLLFKPGDDALTDKGRQALAKLASVFKQSTELQIVVQGHTDDTPLVQPAPVAARPPAPKGRGRVAPITAMPAAPVVRFKTNWELSAARALAIVHYFQDVAKLDPVRLSALAFGQYRPVSATATDAENRRLELVVSPRLDLSRGE